MMMYCLKSEMDMLLVSSEKLLQHFINSLLNDMVWVVILILIYLLVRAIEDYV